MTDTLAKIPRSFRSRALCVTALLIACGSTDTLPRGQLMIAIDTDMAITKDMDQVTLDVIAPDGNILNHRDIDIDVGPPSEVIQTFDGPKRMPGTVAIVPPNAGGQQVLVRVTAKKRLGTATTARIAREAIVKIPTDRVALLSMPLRWLCDGMTEEAGRIGETTLFSSGCGEHETCVAGVCTTDGGADIDVDELPDYAPELVFGGGKEDGTGSRCLDVQTCFAHTETLTPSDECTVPLPPDADPHSLNVSLVLASKSEGHCLDASEGGTCYIPLDSDPTEGFAVDGDRIVLPPAACKRQSVVGVAVSTTCPSKDLSTPVCGPWTGWAVQPKPSMNDGGAGGMSSLPLGGETSSGGTAGESGALGEGGEGGSGMQSCVTADAARATPYFYVVVDASPGMQASIEALNLALRQFVAQPQSAGLRFGLQLLRPACQEDYSTPFIDFTELPSPELLSRELVSPTNDLSVQLDGALEQTLQTLADLPATAARTEVVITVASDIGGCGNLVDVMRQAVTAARQEGISVKPLLIQNEAFPPNLEQGFYTAAGPQPDRLSADQTSSSAAILQKLNQYRDETAGCSFVKPSGSYAVRIGDTTLTRIAAAADCASTSDAYYETRDIFTLCQASCAALGSATPRTESCGTDGTGGRSGGGAGAATAGGSANAGGASGQANVLTTTTFLTERTISAINVNGSQDEVWLVEPNDFTIEVIATNGERRGVVDLHDLNLTALTDVAVSSSVNRGWFTGASEQSLIGTVSGAKLNGVFPSTTPGTAFRSIAAGPDGNGWFLWYQGGDSFISKITPTGEVTDYALSLNPRLHMFLTSALVAGPDENLWVATGWDEVARVTTEGVITRFPITGGNGTRFITAGPDGYLWMTAERVIARIRPSDGETNVFTLQAFGGITSAPDGNLWYITGKTTSNGNSIVGRISPIREITEFALGDTSCRQGDIVSTPGSDGSFYLFCGGPNRGVTRITVPYSP